MKQIFKGSFKVEDSHPSMMVIDPRKYKGRGRPRKEDYSPMVDVMAYSWLELNKSYLERVDSVILK